MVRNFALLLCVLFYAQTNLWSVANARPAASSFKKFSALRDALIDKISNAKARVWLTSEFMSDFDISLALYVAKFRNLDVRVVLSESRLDDFLSQHDYLSDHGVPIKTIASSDAGTYLLCDDDLISVNSDLDFLSDRKSFTLRKVEQTGKLMVKMVETFESAFDGARPSDQVAYDYSRKVHRRPSDVASRLPGKTIAGKNNSSKRGTETTKSNNL